VRRASSISIGVRLGYDQFSCKECGKKFDALKRLAQHLDATRHCKNLSWSCPVCKEGEPWKKLSDLLKHLEEPDDKDEDVIEHNALCNVCNRSIVGVRFKCLDCPDYDECAACKKRGTSHPSDHFFYKMKDPSVRAVPEEPLWKHQQAQNDPQIGLVEYFKKWCEGESGFMPGVDRTYAEAVEGYPSSQYSLASGFATRIFGHKYGLEAMQVDWAHLARASGTSRTP
jgi:hypothetical protein